MSLLDQKLRDALTASPMGVVVEVYVKQRAKRDKLKEAMERESNILAEIAQFGLEKLALAKTEKVGVGDYTAYQSVRESATVKDPEEFRQFLHETQRWDMLENRASIAEVREYLEEHEGALPPGVSLNRMLTFNVRKTK